MGKNNFVKKTGAENYVCENFCFSLADFNLKEASDALKYYESNKKDYREWLFNSNIPIFMDTNVLLDIYRLPRNERDQFLSFIAGNIDRIYVTPQIESEFMIHRVELIDEFKKRLKDLNKGFNDCLEKLNKFKENEIKHFMGFCGNKILVSDMPNTIQTFDELKEFFESNMIFGEKLNEFTLLRDKLKEKFNEEMAVDVSYSEFEYQDDILEKLSMVKSVPQLQPKEKAFLKDLYMKLSEKYKPHKEKPSKNYFTFPGSGDISKLDEGKEPFGDFFIYHEILSFMKQEDTDVIFLTNDIEKDDWVKKDSRNPYSHYIASTYKNTKRAMYILPSNDFIPLSTTSTTESDSVDDDIEVVVTSITENESTISNESAQDNVTEISTKTSSYLREATKEDFINEFNIALDWAQQFGEGFVGKYHFIHNVLGGKRYRYGSSITILNQLKKEGVLMEYTTKGVVCIKMVDEDNENTKN